MESVNWILIGITFVLTGFIIFTRVGEWIQSRKIVRELNAKGEALSIIMEDKKSIVMYAGMTLFVFIASWFVSEDWLERVVMAFVFAVLVGTEVINAWVHSKLYANSKEFVYGQVHERFRSIKGYEKKGQRSTRILLLNKGEHVVPNAVAYAIQLHIQKTKETRK